MNRKRKLDETSSSFLKCSKNLNTLWIDKYKPKLTSDLAVHNKKIQEVSHWIDKQPLNIKTPNILLLTGPSGSGKTATLYSLPNMDIHSWADESEDNVADFSDFLFKTSRYSELAEFNDENRNVRKIILIESFPNKFYMEPIQLHQLLIKYKSIGKCPLVIIISDSQALNYSAHWLIPKSLQMELNIENISFSPIAVTLMKKALTKIIRQEKKNISEKEVQKITAGFIESSNGDIRSAINNLEIFLTIKNYDSKLTATDMNKDNPIFIFRALGKILYCKREKDELEIGKYKEKLGQLAPVTAQQFRPQLLFNPENVFDNCCLDYSTFVNYLQENHLDFIENIDELEEICEDLSYSDFLFNRWLPECSDLFGQYLVSTVTRSMIFHNESRPRNSWHPLRKSCSADLHRSVNRLKLEITGLVEGGAPNLISLQDSLCSNTIFIHTLPFLSKIISKTNRYSDKEKLLDLLKELDFSRRRFNGQENLDEKTAIESSSEVGYRNYCSNHHHHNNHHREEFNEWSVCKEINEDNVCIIELDE